MQSLRVLIVAVMFTIVLVTMSEAMYMPFPMERGQMFEQPDFVRGARALSPWSYASSSGAGRGRFNF